MIRRRQLLLAMVSIATGAWGTGGLQAGTLHLSEPGLDRWMYVNNNSAGSRGIASTFSALPSSTEDENRLAQFIVGFDTRGAGLPEPDWQSVEITRVTVTATCVDDGAFRYDPSYDPFASYLPGATDEDPGRPVEIHGTGYRNDYDAQSFQEHSPHGSAAPYGRNAFPLGFDASGLPTDVGHNVSDGFESSPWAIGSADLTPGEPVPYDTPFSFEIDLSQPPILAYIRDSLSSGQLCFTLSSLHPATQQAGEYVNYYSKESSEHLVFGDLAPTLTIEFSGAPAPQAPILEITHLELDPLSGLLEIAWNQDAGFNYILQESSDIGVWSVIRSEVATADGTGSYSTTATPGMPARFYKVLRESTEN